MNKIETEDIKELFAEWGLWSLVDDISDDGDGHGDNLQLTKEGLEAERMINQLLEEKTEQSNKVSVNGKEWKKRLKEILDGNSWEEEVYDGDDYSMIEYFDKEMIIKELIGFISQLLSEEYQRGVKEGTEGKFYEKIEVVSQIPEEVVEQLLSERTFTKEELFMLKLAVNDIYNNGNNAYEGISKKISKLLKE